MGKVRTLQQGFSKVFQGYAGEGWPLRSGLGRSPGDGDRVAGGGERGCVMMHLRQPILLPKGEPLRAMIHARFSTEEQRQSSIDDQVASCPTFLESNPAKGWKPEKVVIDVIAEPEVSGEIADRLGINQVWAGIEASGRE